jgi:hypothetical protein
MFDQETAAIPFTTDLGSVVLFDPEVLESRIREPGDWWQEGNLLDLPELSAGKVVILPLGLEGDSSARVSQASLLEQEQGYARMSFPGLGLEVTSGRVFLGAAERLPGDGRGVVAVLQGQGGFYRIPKGLYDVRVQALDWHFDDQWYKADGSVKAGAPAEYVFFLSRRSPQPYQAPQSLPVLTELRNRPELKIAAASAPVLIGEARRQTRVKGPADSPRKSKTEPAKAPEPAGLRALRNLFEASEVLSKHLQCEPSPIDADAIFALVSGNEKPQSHSWPVSEVYKKVTRVREQLRVLEQKVNTSSLSLMEKVDLEESVTAIYQSLAHLTAF